MIPHWAIMQRNIDPYCDYKMFRSRIGGEIACVALGDGNIKSYESNLGEITGVTFQKVDSGLVKPVLLSNTFTAVDWPNASTRNGQRQYLPLAEPLFAPTQRWHEFANFMFHLRNAFMRRMTPANGQLPATLYDGLHNTAWKGESSDFDVQMEVLQTMGQHWGNSEKLQQFAFSVMKGFIDGGEVIGPLLSDLLHVYVFEGEVLRRLKQAPAESSMNKPLEDGVVHCLVYGNNADQLYFVQSGQFENRGKIQHRVLLPQSLGLQSRSRSRSPSPVSDLENHVERRHTDPNLPNSQISMQDMLKNPDDFILEARSLHHYFEPHKPNFMTYTQNSNGVSTSLLIEVSSYVKYGQSKSFDAHLQICTERCVQQCLTALSKNQMEISGLVIVPDGWKIIRVDKQNNPNVSYTVHETRFVNWHETPQLYASLQYLERVI